MIARHPYRAVGAVLAVLLPSLFLTAMIGQHNDGPWGGLPPWLGAASYVTWLTASVVLVVLSTYLGVASMRYRRAVR